MVNEMSLIYTASRLQQSAENSLECCNVGVWMQNNAGRVLIWLIKRDTASKIRQSRVILTWLKTMIVVLCAHQRKWWDNISTHGMIVRQVVVRGVSNSVDMHSTQAETRPLWWLCINIEISSGQAFSERNIAHMVVKAM